MARWCWGPRPDGDWNDTFDTREDAEEHGRTDGREEHDLEGDDCGYVAEEEPIEPADYARLAADAESIVESMDEQGDLGCAFDDPVFRLIDKAAAQAALERALMAWATEHVSNGGHFLLGVPQRVEPVNSSKSSNGSGAQP